MTCVAPWPGLAMALAFALAASVFATGVRAQEASVASQVMDACATDIDRYCSSVTPGRGRLLACFVAHEDKLSAACVNKLYDLTDRLQALANSIGIIGRECGRELDTLCADVSTGEGRVLHCLDANFDQARSGCQAALTGLGVHQAD